MAKKTENAINPHHYNRHKFQPIDVIKDWDLGFNLGNVVKYISRCGHKDAVKQELEKAMFYLKHEIDNLK